MDDSFRNNLTASAGGSQAGATPITTTYSRFSIVATAGDSAILPPAAGGLAYTVKNAGVNALSVFPQPGDQINALGLNSPFAILPGKSSQFFSLQGAIPTVIGGQWDTLP